MKVINKNSKSIDFYTAVELMDAEICVKLSDALAPCSQQQFFTAYEKAHEEKYGEAWELSKSNPVY